LNQNLPPSNDLTDDPESPHEKAPGPSETAGKGGDEDIAALAKGGRTNVFGFLLRLAARIPFLFIAGRLYGAETLGRFAYAILVVEFAAQIATLGMKRGLAQQLSKTRRPHVHVVWDGLLTSFIAAAFAATFLMLVPQIMFPNSGINGLDRFLPLVIIMLAASDISLAALAYRFDIASTVRARAVIEPWTISIAALIFFYIWPRDGLILAYVASMVAAVTASLWPLIASYGLPRGWRPQPLRLLALARGNIPLAAADAAEWGSRRLDLAILGLFASPAVVGIYYVAQQVASLPQKLKTSFDPILGPVITRNLEAGNLKAIGRQVSQVGFWIIAAQVGVALALGIPAAGVMGVIGPGFAEGSGALMFLLAAEAVAATAVVSEAALIYMARHRNLVISLSMLLFQATLSLIFIQICEKLGWSQTSKAMAVAAALMFALAYASIVKAVFLSRLLAAPVNGWRWTLIAALMVGASVGYAASFGPEWFRLSFGIALTLISYGWVIWKWGFHEDDRALFRRTNETGSASPSTQQ